MEVTEAAKKELKEKLAGSTDKADMCLRLKADSDGKLGLALSHEAESDIVIEHEGKKLLLVAKELAATMENAVIDIEDTKEGRRLVVRTK